MSKIIELSKPSMRGTRTLEEVLYARRSNRHLVERPVESENISQLLWAAQGIRDASGLRTAPSAGQRYPLDVYLVGENGVPHYLPEDHVLEQISDNGHPRVAQRRSEEPGRYSRGVSRVCRQRGVRTQRA